MLSLCLCLLEPFALPSLLSPPFDLFSKNTLLRVELHFSFICIDTHKFVASQRWRRSYLLKRTLKTQNALSNIDEIAQLLAISDTAKSPCESWTKSIISRLLLLRYFFSRCIIALLHSHISDFDSHIAHRLRIANLNSLRVLRAERASAAYFSFTFSNWNLCTTN